MATKANVPPLLASDVLAWVVEHPRTPHDTDYVAALLMAAASTFVGGTAMTLGTVEACCEVFEFSARKEFQKTNANKRKARKGRK